MQSSKVRRVYDVTGVVQGVGFRPAVFRLAIAAGLAGWVQNRSDVVRIALEGTSARIREFMRELPSRLPENARIDSVVPVETRTFGPSEMTAGFSILESSNREDVEVVIPADLGMCPECAAEIGDPGNRRYGYPFTTCTACGPRYTVVKSMPYDRERTTMSGFPLCDKCREEYESPEDRRFHAESIACPACGPRLLLTNAAGKPVDGDPLRQARRELSRGHIVAVRGIGGFLLAADALNPTALTLLRERKLRSHKPFAVMAPDVRTLKSFCVVTHEAGKLLESSASPIVILDVKPEAADTERLPLDLITPDTMTLGAMLPTSPLHQLLLEPLRDDPVPLFRLLVMTSGNRRGEPICLSNAEARERLGGVADYILCHDREINLRNDDSLCIIQNDMPQVWRRARGYAPNPIRLHGRLSRCILAMGAEIKNTIAMGFDTSVVMSPHIGDLDSPEAVDGLKQAVKTLPSFLGRTPQTVAVDLHPDMHSTMIGREIAGELDVPTVEVQHHYAHAVACLAEHGHSEGLALTFDGTGLGTDGTIWGAELLHVSRDGFDRLATFRGVPLPGGDAAVRHPARQLVARWTDCGDEISDEWLEKLGIAREHCEILAKQCRRRVNAPVTHAAGRVFDAFAVLLGVAPDTTTYDGQAAIRLEALARRHGTRDVPELPLSFEEKAGVFLVDWREAFSKLVDPATSRGKESAWAMAVHQAVAEAALEMLRYGLTESNTRAVALSGGVFMNRILNDLLIRRLNERHIQALIHRVTPPNDGCISLGQAVAAGME